MMFMLHNQGLKSKGEKQQWREANVNQKEGRRSFPPSYLALKGSSV